MCRILEVGSSEMVTIDQLVDTAESIAGVRLERAYPLDAPLGVPRRSSHNTFIRELNEGWEPSTPLRTCLDETYHWIEEQYPSQRRQWPRGPCYRAAPLYLHYEMSAHDQRRDS
jgi:nucleoside-diphosphate-sugar epimerase